MGGDVRFQAKITSQYLTELGQRIQTLPPDEASALLLEGSTILIFAGFPKIAYQGLIKLTQGELQISKASALSHRLQDYLISLCLLLERPCPSLWGEPEKSLETLREYTAHRFWRCFGHFNPDLSGAKRWLKVAEDIEDPRYGEPLDYSQEERLIHGIQTYLEWEDSESVTKLIRLWWRTMGDLHWGASRLSVMPGLVVQLGQGVLQDVIPLSQENAIQFLEAVGQRQYDASAPKSIPTLADWKNFLEQWNQAILSNLDEESREYCEEYYLDDLESGMCFREGASEKEIDKLEKHLGQQLPLSYRNFLLASNGFTVLDQLNSDLYGTDDVNWFVDENLDWAEIWEDEDDIDDEKYFQYGEHQDCCWMRGSYMKSALQISSTGEGEVYLLNPKVVDSRGEWEAWDFGNAYPGAFRYRSFWEMAQALYQQTLRSQ